MAAAPAAQSRINSAKTGNKGHGTLTNSNTKVQQKAKGDIPKSKSAVSDVRVDSSKSKSGAGSTSTGTPKVTPGVSTTVTSQPTGGIKGPLALKVEKSPMKSVGNSTGRSRLDRSPVKSSGIESPRARIDASPMRSTANNPGSGRARVDKSPVRSANGPVRSRVDASPMRSSGTGTMRSRADKSPMRTSGSGSGRISRADASPMRTSGNTRARTDASPGRAGTMKPRVDSSPMRSARNGDVKARVETNVKTKAVESSPVVTASKGAVKAAVKAFNKTEETPDKMAQAPRSLSSDGKKCITENDSSISKVPDGTSVISKGNNNVPNSGKTGSVGTSAARVMSHGEESSAGRKQQSMTTPKATPLKPPTGKRVPIGMSTPLSREVLETSVGGTSSGMFKTPSPFVMKTRRYTMDELKDCQATPECFSTVAFETPRTNVKHRWVVCFFFFFESD